MPYPYSDLAIAKIITTSPDVARLLTPEDIQAWLLDQWGIKCSLERIQRVQEKAKKYEAAQARGAA